MIKKLIFVVLILVVVVGGGTCLQPWTTEYEVKTAAKIACNDYIRVVKGYGDPKWAEGFVRRASIAGVKLKEGQYAFDFKDNPGASTHRCNYKIAWRSTTPWFGLSDFFPDIPPLRQVHRLDSFHELPKSF